MYGMDNGMEIVYGQYKMKTFYLVLSDPTTSLQFSDAFKGL